MNKLAEDFGVAWLGACAGLFTGSLFLLVERVDAYYVHLARLQETDYEGYGIGVNNLWWLPVLFWHVLLFTGASLLVHRYLAMRLRSRFLLWQVVGVGALAGWLCSLATMVSLECLMRGDMDALERVLTSRTDWFVAKFVATVFAANVAYGSVLQSAIRQDTEAVALLQRREA